MAKFLAQKVDFGANTQTHYTDIHCTHNTMRQKEGEIGQFVTGWQWLYFLVFFSEALDYIHIHVAFAPGVSGMGKAFFHVDCYLDD